MKLTMKASVLFQVSFVLGSIILINKTVVAQYGEDATKSEPTEHRYTDDSQTFSNRLNHTIKDAKVRESFLRLLDDLAKVKGSNVTLKNLMKDINKKRGRRPSKNRFWGELWANAQSVFGALPGMNVVSRVSETSSSYTSSVNTTESSGGVENCLEKCRCKVIPNCSPISCPPLPNRDEFNPNACAIAPVCPSGCKLNVIKASSIWSPKPCFHTTRKPPTKKPASTTKPSTKKPAATTKPPSAKPASTTKPPTKKPASTTKPPTKKPASSTKPPSKKPKPDTKPPNSKKPKPITKPPGTKKPLPPKSTTTKPSSSTKLPKTTKLSSSTKLPKTTKPPSPTKSPKDKKSDDESKKGPTKSTSKKAVYRGELVLRAKLKDSGDILGQIDSLLDKIPPELASKKDARIVLRYFKEEPEEGSDKTISVPGAIKSTLGHLLGNKPSRANRMGVEPKQDPSGQNQSEKPCICPNCPFNPIPNCDYSCPNYNGCDVGQCECQPQMTKSALANMGFKSIVPAPVSREPNSPDLKLEDEFTVPATPPSGAQIQPDDPFLVTDNRSETPSSKTRRL